MAAIPTVAIVAPDAALGWMRINESEFDAKRHQLYAPGRKQAETQSENVGVAAVSANDTGEPGYRVTRDGSWWTLWGPDGKVGASKRTRDQVIAQAPEGAVIAED